MVKFVSPDIIIGKVLEFSLNKMYDIGVQFVGDKKNK